MMDPTSTRLLRQQMINKQLLARGLNDPKVLHAMQQIPREHFVPDLPVETVYRDGPLTIGHGQTISQPYMVAIMASLLQLNGTETVLEVGAGSGYGAAVLALLAKKVVAIERIPALLEKAQSRWQSLGIDNIIGVMGDGSQGCEQQAPYDGISVTAAAPHIPQSLLAQLCVNTGILVIPAGPRFSQMLLVVRRNNLDQAVITEQFACVFVPLLGKEGWSDIT